MDADCDQSVDAVLAHVAERPVDHSPVDVAQRPVHDAADDEAGDGHDDAITRLPIPEIRRTKGRREAPLLLLLDIVESMLLSTGLRLNPARAVRAISASTASRCSARTPGRGKHDRRHASAHRATRSGRT